MTGVATRTTSIVIGDGGTAAWLSAYVIAARANAQAADPLRVMLVRLPDVPMVGEGRGTWPIIRATSARNDRSEADFRLACDQRLRGAHRERLRYRYACRNRCNHGVTGWIFPRRAGCFPPPANRGYLGALRRAAVPALSKETIC